MTHDPKTYRFFLMTVDPVHVGTGGARLGRVDNPIVREPGTNLPKIPGSSLHGVIRTYAAHRYGKPQCAGQGQREGRQHCGRPTCPICYTFGYARDREGGHAGVVAIGDARILLFPVYSMVGPVWVTSPSALYTAGFGEQDEEGNLRPFSVDANDEGKARWDFSAKQHLNLGWLMVNRENGLPFSPDDLPNEIPEQIRNRVVLVSDKLFSQIVNSNLEVRTSVAINPETGAAEEKALFTYEAIPRATILSMDMVVSDYRGEFPTKSVWIEKCRSYDLCRNEQVNVNPLQEEMPSDETKEEQFLRELGYIGGRPEKGENEAEEEYRNRERKYWDQVRSALENLGQAWNLKWDSPRDVVKLGLEWAEHLGVGGMGTRGFGRIRKLIDCPVETNGTLGSPCSNEDDAHGGTEDTEENSL